MSTEEKQVVAEADPAIADPAAAVSATNCEVASADNAAAAKTEDDKQSEPAAADGGVKDTKHWDQTSRKVVVRNVLKYIRAKEITKLTKEWLKGHEDTIQIVKTKKPPKDNWIKVTLAEDSMVEPFIDLINKGGKGGDAMVNGRGKPLCARRADEFLTKGGGGGDDRDNNNGDNRNKRSRDGDDGNNNNNKRNKREERVITILSTDEVRDKITPLWRLPYEEQLDSKAREMATKCAAKIVNEIKKKFKVLEKEAKRGQRKSAPPKVYEWLENKRAINMDQPVPNPQIYEYRNKCEFTVGYRLVAPPAADSSNGDNTAVAKKEKDDEEMEDAKVKVAGVADEAKETAVKEEEQKEGGEVTKDEETKAKEEDNKDEVKDSVMAKAEDAAEVKKEEDSNTATEEKKEVINFTKIPSAGFLAQGWSGGVYPPHSLQNMPDWSCGLADIFNEFLPASSMPPYDSKTHRGMWRTITLRCSLRTRECMVIVLHAPAKGGAGALEDGSDDYSDVFESEKKRLVEMLTKDVIPTPKRDFPENHVKSGDDNVDGLRVTSIYFQEYDGLSHPAPDHPVQHVYGKTSFEEQLRKCAFQISPGAFFQTNTKGAEVLYQIVVDRVKEVTTEPEQTLLVDVCCGTGTIGLTCLKEGVVGKLVGVDIAEPAIEDAKINAEKNGYKSGEGSTTKFVASPAEKVLPEVMYNIPRNSPVVAVVDPARDGLHGVVVRTLRSNQKIQRLVYVSCNPTATLVRDAAMLCSPPTKRYPGIPFKPTMSQPVDMFPLTKHCEMVMTFDRMSEEEYEKYHGGE